MARGRKKSGGRKEPQQIRGVSCAMQIRQPPDDPGRPLEGRDVLVLALVDGVHEQLHAVALTRRDLDDAVEIALGVALTLLDITLDQIVVAGVDIVVERRRNLASAAGDGLSAAFSGWRANNRTGEKL